MIDGIDWLTDGRAGWLADIDWLILTDWYWLTDIDWLILIDWYWLIDIDWYINWLTELYCLPHILFNLHIMCIETIGIPHVHVMHKCILKMYIEDGELPVAMFRMTYILALCDLHSGNSPWLIHTAYKNKNQYKGKIIFGEKSYFFPKVFTFVQPKEDIL